MVGGPTGFIWSCNGDDEHDDVVTALSVSDEDEPEAEYGESRPGWFTNIEGYQDRFAIHLHQD